jgi:hypothetical protein
MTTVNVSAVTNTVTVTENGSSTVVTVPVTSTVTAVTVGPQGPTGPTGPGGLVVDEVSKIDKSIVYYDAASAVFKADSTWTVPTLADGGNF